MSSSIASILRRAFGVAVLTAGAVTLTGCGGVGKGGAADSVSGKVTLDGQPVAGEVFFVGSDKKEVGSPIGPEGNYEISNPPKGDVLIVVKGKPGIPSIPGAKAAPDLPPPPTATGVAPPAKYGQPNNGLKFTVTGGKQVYDIVLTK